MSEKYKIDWLNVVVWSGVFIFTFAFWTTLAILIINFFKE